MAHLGEAFVGGDEIDQQLEMLGRQQTAAWGAPPGTSSGHQAVAEVYVAAWTAGDSPTRAVAEHFTISHSAAAKRVSRAREAGFLPQTKQGRAGLGDPK
ncbi:hypothetical protein BH10ACT8_BH10ACT8_11320 [soil metagenome]